MEYRERNVGTKGKSPKQDLTSAKDLTIEREKLKQSLSNIELAFNLRL